MIERNVDTLKNYIGKILLRKYDDDHVWLFKVVDVLGPTFLTVTHVMYIKPKPRTYLGQRKTFFKTYKEYIGYTSELRTPTQEEYKQYKQYAKKLIYLGHF